jgi:hypothetical protein
VGCGRGRERGAQGLGARTLESHVTLSCGSVILGRPACDARRLRRGQLAAVRRRVPPRGSEQGAGRCALAVTALSNPHRALRLRSTRIEVAASHPRHARARTQTRAASLARGSAALRAVQPLCRGVAVGRAAGHTLVLVLPFEPGLRASRPIANENIRGDFYHDL